MAPDHPGLADAEIDRHDPRRVRHLDLRYQLTDLMVCRRRVWKVAELVDALRAAGFVLGRPDESASKLVSSALRTEIKRGRVIRVGWGRYQVHHIPDSTLRRICKRARARRELVRAWRVAGTPGLPVSQADPTPWSAA